MAGQSTSLQTPLSISIQSGVNSIEYQQTAESLFFSSIGLPTCSVGGVASISAATTPALQSTVYEISATITPTGALTGSSQISPSTPSASAISSTGLSTSDRIAIGVAVPIGTIVLLMISILFWIRKHRRSRLDRLELQELEVLEKPELEAEEVGHEMQGTEAKHSLNGEETQQELSASDHLHELESPR